MTTETQALFGDLNKPSLHTLSYVLRNPDMWPKGFVWDYQSCDQCAMGLAHRLWKVGTADRGSGATLMARTFSLPYATADSIFMGAGPWMPTRIKTKSVSTGFLGLWKEQQRIRIADHRSVTPEMVADQIDAYLKTQENGRAVPKSEVHYGRVIPGDILG